jgi:hypothetical protein
MNIDVLSAKPHTGLQVMKSLHVALGIPFRAFPPSGSPGFPCQTSRQTLRDPFQCVYLQSDQPQFDVFAAVELGAARRVADLVGLTSIRPARS